MFKNNHHYGSRPKGIRILLIIAVFLAIVSAVSWLIMLLWNHILVDNTGVKPLNFWKAAGLLILAKILFGGFKKRGFDRSPFANKREWRQKWMEMSTEERQEAKKRWKEHCRKNEKSE